MPLKLLSCLSTRPYLAVSPVADVSKEKIPRKQKASSSHRPPKRRRRSLSRTNHGSALSLLRRNIVGRDEMLDGPFGPRRLLHCDWTAAGKALYCVEKYILSEVLTLHASIHAQTNATCIQMTHFREQARQIIFESVHGSPSRDVVLFAGTGATGAIAKMAGIIQRSPSFDAANTVIFIGPDEHCPNIAIWKEIGVQLVVIPENPGASGLNQKILASKLADCAKTKLCIGFFSATNNMTGICEDTIGVTKLLHVYNALAFWNFASAAPYLDVRVTCEECEKGTDRPVSKDCACFDAVFMSPHKMIGGPGTPDVLVVKRHVISIGRTDCEYKTDVTEREKDDTQDTVGTIRAALAFKAKDSVGVDEIVRIEQSYITRVFDKWSANDRIRLIGFDCRPSDEAKRRLATFSFCILREWNGMRKKLHHNFVAVLLNDLFGIQGHGEDLGGITRLNFHYTMTDAEVDYVIDAVSFVADHGFKFLPLYRLDTSAEQWMFDGTHSNGWTSREYHQRDLNSVQFRRDGVFECEEFHRGNDDDAVLDKYLAQAKQLVEDGILYEDVLFGICETSLGDEYWMPQEIMDQLFPGGFLFEASSSSTEEERLLFKRRCSIANTKSK